FDVGHASDGNENLVRDDPVFLALLLEHDRLRVILFLSPQDFRTQRDANSLSVKLLRHHTGRIRVLARQEARALREEEDIAAEASESLRELATNGAGSYHRQAAWQLG